MLWEIEQLSPPGRDAEASLTEWTQYPATDEMKTSRRPGVDYKVREGLNNNPEYIVFPATRILATFRHEWILRKCYRPMVPSMDGVKMPDREKTREERCRLFSLYMRPWVLDATHESIYVPHLRNLGFIPCAQPDSVKRRRLTQKQTGPLSGRRRYEAAWRWYLRGHIVSRHAQRLITQFLAASCGKSKTRDVVEECEAKIVSDGGRVASPDLSLERVHNVISQIAARACR